MLLSFQRILFICDHFDKYREKIDDLIKEANLEVKFPFFSIKHAKTKKSNVQRRHKSFVEINKINHQRDQGNAKVLLAFSKHFAPEKANKNNLLQLSTALLTAMPTLPKPTREEQRSKIIDWYRTNWDAIAPLLSTISSSTS